MRINPILLISSGLLILGCQYQTNVLATSEPESSLGLSKTQGVSSESPQIGVLQMQIACPALDNWDSVTVQLSHPAFKSNPLPRFFTKGVNLVPFDNTYIATESFGQILPMRGYLLTTDIWSGGASGSLVAENQQTLDWIVGRNVATVSPVVIPPLTLSTVTPDAGLPGTEVMVTGDGLSILPQNDKVLIGTASAAITPISSTSLKAVVPDIAPDYYPVSLQVGSNEALGSFTVLGTEGSPQGWDNLGGQCCLPAIAPGVDRYCLIWMDKRSQPTIYGRILNTNGQTLEPDFRVLSGPLNPDVMPRIGFDAYQKRYLVVAEYTTGDGDIYAQLFNKSQYLNSRIEVAAHSFPERNPFVCTGDKHLILWEEIQDPEKRICGRYMERDGRLPVPAFAIATESIACSNPSAAYSANTAKFFVTWMSSEFGGLMGRLIKPGATATDPILISSNVSAQYRAGVAWNSLTGEFLVAWLGGDNIIYGQRISSTGVPIGDPITISACSQCCSSPEIAYQPWHRKYIVAWTDQRNGYNAGYAQHISEDGTPWGANFPISTANVAQDTCGITINSKSRRSLVLYQSSNEISVQKLR